MLNSSSLCKAFAFSVASVSLSAAVVVTDATGIGHTEGGVGLPLVLSAASLIAAVATGVLVSRARRFIVHASAILGKAARGDLEARAVLITERGELGDMLTDINQLLDVVDSFGREAKASMEAVDEGLITARLVSLQTSTSEVDERISVDWTSGISARRCGRNAAAVGS